MMPPSSRQRLDRSLQPFKKIERALVGNTSVATTAAVSARMARIRRHDTAPELRVRQAARSLGLRLTLNNRDLPGSPDLANRSRKIAIFVHGCFWHRHRGCKRATTPKSNREFWEAKFRANRARDRKALRLLRERDFTTLVIWECVSLDRSHVVEILSSLVGP